MPHLSFLSLVCSIIIKVLSSEMDPAEIRLIRQVVIKERGTEVFRKNLPIVHTCIVRAL